MDDQMKVIPSLFGDTDENAEPQIVTAHPFHALDFVDWDDPLSYVRAAYGVPAYEGRRVTTYSGEQGEIVGGDHQYVLVRLDGHETASRYHPTWRMEYHEARPIS